MTSFVPGRSRSRNASMFFSTATRPTYTKIGRGRSRNPLPDGLNSSTSTPRVQRAMLRNPRVSSCLCNVGVATIVRAAAE
jgi:hypothetical protein